MMKILRNKIWLLVLWFLLCTVQIAGATAPGVNPRFTAISSTGAPWYGAQLYTYVTGTTTPKTTWTSATKGTANTNPVILDQYGQADIWLDSSTGGYRLRLVDPEGVEIWTKDSIYDSAGAASETVAGVVRQSTDAEIEAGSNVTAFVAPDQFKKYNGFIDSVAALKLRKGYDGETVYLNYHTTNGDGGQGTFRWDASSTAADDNGVTIAVTGVATGRWVRQRSGSSILVDWFGPDGISDAIAAQAANDYIVSLGIPANLIFTSGKQYTFTSTVNFNLPEHSCIIATGASIVATHNGVLFDINSNASAAIPILVDDDALTKRDITWRGGYITCTNATKTASVAIQAYMMRGFRLENAYMSGFYAAVKYAGKDTYRFTDCYTYNNTRHFWVPAPGVVYTSTLTGNDLIDVKFTNNIMSISSAEAGIYFENRVIAFKLSGGNINGTPSVAHIIMSDNVSSFSRGIAFENTSMEQMQASKPAIQFNATGGQGFYGVSFGNGLSIVSGNVGWYGIVLDKCLGVQIGASVFQDGSGGATEQGIYVDNDSRDIEVHDSCKFVGFATGQAIVLETATNRQHISIYPTVVPDATVLTGYNGATFSTATETLDMSTVYSNFGNYLLPPKGYFITLRAADIGSGGAAAATIRTRLKKEAAAADSTGVCSFVGSLPNSLPVVCSGAVAADANGDFYRDTTATGAGTTTLSISVNGVIQ